MVVIVQIDNGSCLLMRDRALRDGLYVFAVVSAEALISWIGDLGMCRVDKGVWGMNMLRPLVGKVGGWATLG